MILRSLLPGALALLVLELALVGLLALVLGWRHYRQTQREEAAQKAILRAQIQLHQEALARQRQAHERQAHAPQPGPIAWVVPGDGKEH